MIYVGIDVAKDKHDCFICNSEGKVKKRTSLNPNVFLTQHKSFSYDFTL